MTSSRSFEAPAFSDPLRDRPCRRRVRRLTRHARLADPDLALLPMDGDSIAVRVQSGARQLVLLGLRVAPPTAHPRLVAPSSRPSPPLVTRATCSQRRASRRTAGISRLNGAGEGHFPKSSSSAPICVTPQSSRHRRRARTSPRNGMHPVRRSSSRQTETAARSQFTRRRRAIDCRSRRSLSVRLVEGGVPRSRPMGAGAVCRLHRGRIRSVYCQWRDALSTPVSDRCRTRRPEARRPPYVRR